MSAFALGIVKFFETGTRPKSHGALVIECHRNPGGMAALLGDVGADRLRQAAAQSLPAMAAADEKQTDKPNAVFGIITDHIDYCGDPFVCAEKAIDEFVAVFFAGREFGNETLKHGRAGWGALNNFEIVRIGLK